MRQVVLDTETTGLEWQKGNRVVEIGCVELLERRPTGRTFHTYLCPDREFEPGAQEVTGLSVEFLADKPRFHEVADDLLAFIDGAEVLMFWVSRRWPLRLPIDARKLVCRCGARDGETAVLMTDHRPDPIPPPLADAPATLTRTSSLPSLPVR